MDKPTKSADVSSPIERVVMRPIASWEELATVEDSEHYSLEIEDGCGWVVPKNPADDILGGGKYLSTHTFYGKTHEYSTRLLQDCGFSVEIVSWDA